MVGQGEEEVVVDADVSVVHGEVFGRAAASPAARRKTRACEYI